jgi:hypothetical protein
MDHSVTFDGRWILERQSSPQWSEQLRRLSSHPVGRRLLNDTPVPRRWKVDALAGYAWLRARGLVPRSMWPVVDRHPGVVWVMSPALIALTRLLRLRRGEGGTSAPWPYVVHSGLSDSVVVADE